MWVWRPENQVSWLCKFQSKCRRGQCPILKTERVNPLFPVFHSLQVPHRLEAAHPHWEGQSALLSLPMVYLTHKHPTHTLRMVFKSVSQHFMAQSSWHIELIITAVIITTAILRVPCPLSPPNTKGLFKKIYLYTDFWLHWVFIAALRLSLVAASGGYFLVERHGLLSAVVLLLQTMGCRTISLQ